MFHPVVSSDISVVRARSRRPARVSAPPTLAEAYDVRLLGEVARWDDQAAFESLYETHVDAVTRAALSICDDAGAAEDIAQQTFTALWIRAGRIAERSLRVRPWLCTVARNAALEYMRKEREAPGGGAPAVASGAGPEQLVFEAQTASELHGAIARLPLDQRRAVEMVYFSALSYAGAAEALGCPVQTVRSLVRRALVQLRERLSP
jgi:RNA polymerase sigma-70 factor (ECF subfamily)